MLFQHVPLKEKMFFARHMAIMARSGMQIVDILKTLRKQSKSGTFRKILDDLIEGVRNGQFISDGLNKYRSIFGDFFINILHIGEISGTLSENLEYLAESLKKKKELEGKVRGAMVYPLIILVAAGGLTAAMTFFIFPKILPIFKSLKVELPMITKIFIAVSTFMISNGVYVFLGIFAAVIAFFLLLRIKVLRHIWHRFLLMLPIAGTMVRNYNMVVFVRSLSLLMKSGVKIVQAIEITANSSTNLVYKEALGKVAESVGRGESISKELVMHKKLFSDIFTQMIQVGEETGKLSDTGAYLADYFETELDNSTKTLSGVLEPIMLLIMGFIVGFIALSIILPIYEVSQHIGTK